MSTTTTPTIGNAITYVRLWIENECKHFDTVYDAKEYAASIHLGAYVYDIIDVIVGTQANYVRYNQSGDCIRSGEL